MARKIFRPEVFQGHMRQKSYFEGWYFKHVALADQTADPNQPREVFAVIPGISLVNRRDRHAFIQIIESSHETHYLTYDIDEFKAGKRSFSIQIGGNYFSRKGITLNIDREEVKLAGTISYEGVTPYPVTLASPGIMGWYGYVPFMECFHGVVSINHMLNGTMDIDGRTVVFTGGKGYIEKDWGKSFPRDYIWMQCNNFANERVSFMLSIATIPWMGKEFVGFLGFLHTGEQMYRFATYNRSTIQELAVSDNAVSIRIGSSRYDLWITVQGKDSGSLAAPRSGNMDRYIKESVMSRVRITLKDKLGNMLFDGTGDPAGFEISGDVEKLF